MSRSGWYNLKKPQQGGQKWLRDMRQWWRRSGRTLDVQADGLSSATRTSGIYELQFSGQDGPLAKLAPGEYLLLVEAAREGGGREILQLPFHWPPTLAQTESAQGSSELGRIAMRLQ